MRSLRKEVSFVEFEKYSHCFNAVPLVREMPLGRNSPFDMYRRVAEKGGFSLLLESGISRSNEGRFSFLATKPERIFTLTNGSYKEEGPKGDLLRSGGPEVFEQSVEEYISIHKNELFDGLPPFCGGLAGYLGYEMVQYWEKLFHHNPERKLKESPFPEAMMMAFRSVVAIDHLYERIFLIETVRIPEGATSAEKKTLYDEGLLSLEELERKISEPKFPMEFEDPTEIAATFRSNMTESCFLSMVEEAKERIRSGDICQVVLSQRFTAQAKVNPLTLYQALKSANPSPYMFLLDLKDFRLIGSSPEVLVRVEGSKVTTRPLAGTRRRGRCPTEDRHLEDDLLSDEKERAEHLMLVDLARNDLGKVCVPGTVKVTELMGIEKYSKVMHIVSNVEGIKRRDCTFLDVLRSTFPAGTVSGAPKVRAMEIIEELEPDARGPYAGAVGYIGFGGDMDMCITIRTFLQEGGKLHVQAGAGIVYDSVPEKEYEETKNKAKALIKILEGQRTKGVA
jgi:anthranilate synthase component 1